MKTHPAVIVLLAAFTGAALAVTAFVALQLTSGDGEPVSDRDRSTDVVTEPIPLDQIDKKAWIADLGDLNAAPLLDALPRLHELVAENCQRSTDMLAVQLTVPGADPEVDKVNFQYVCPSQVSRIDDAVEQLNETRELMEQSDY